MRERHEFLAGMAALIVGSVLMLVGVSFLPAIISRVELIFEGPEPFRQIMHDVGVSFLGEAIYGILGYAFGFISSFIFVKRKYELRIRVILTRMTKSIEAVLLDRNLPPITAAKKIVMLQQTGLARLQRIAGALNSELNALSSLMAQREAGGG